MEITITKSSIFHRTGRHPFTNYFEAAVTDQSDGRTIARFDNTDLATMKQVIRRRFAPEKITFKVVEK